MIKLQNSKVTENIRKNKLIYWAITINEKRNLIRTICLFNFSAENDKAVIGYELLPNFNGKGIMQEAVSRVIEFGFQNMHLKSIEAYTHSKNQSSTKLLEKLNFKKQPRDNTIANKDFVMFKRTKNN